MPTFLAVSFAPWSWTALDWLNHLWQSTAIGLVLLGLLVSCRSLSARTRHLMGWMALAKFALPMAWVVSSFQFLRAAPPVLLLPATWPSALAIRPAPEEPTSFSVSGLVVAIWLAGSAVLLAAWLLQARRSRRAMLAGIVPTPESLRLQVTAAATRLGLAREPQCVTVAGPHGPAVFGVFSPVLVWPQGLEHSLTPAEIEAILLHELAHVRRHDPLWNTLQSVVVRLLWFNPVAWLLHRRIALEAEKACDELVVDLTRDADTYAGSIVKTVKFSLGSIQPGMAATTPPIIMRLKNILAHAHRPHRPLAQGTALAVAALAILLSGFAGSLTAASLPERAATPGPAQPAPQKRTGTSSNETLSVDFPDTEVRDILRNVADLFEFNLVVPEQLKGRINLKLRDVTWRQIYQEALSPLGFTFVVEENVVRIVRKTG